MRDPLHAMTESVNSTLTDHHGLFPAFVHGEEYLSLWTVDDRGSSLQSHPHESLACVSEQVKCSFDQKCMCYANFLTLNSLIFTKIWVPWNPPGHKRVSREENRRLVFLRERWPQQKHPLVLFCAFHEADDIAEAALISSCTFSILERCWMNPEGRFSDCHGWRLTGFYNRTISATIAIKPVEKAI